MAQAQEVKGITRRRFLKLAGAGVAAVGSGGGLTQAQANTLVVPEKVKGMPAAMPMNHAIEVINPDILALQAQQVMTPGAYAYIAHGAGDEWTLNENRRAFNDFPIRAHRLAGVAADAIDLRTELLGHPLSAPIVVAPMGAHLFAHPEGEVATASGAALADTLYQSSGASTRTLEDIAKATRGAKWFQLYFNADIGVTKELLQRAKAAGYTAIIITADALGPGASDSFQLLGNPYPPGLVFANHDPKQGGRGNFLAQKIDLTPSDIGFVKAVTGLPVIVKGLLRGEDADVCIRAGADAIQVSNHGGRPIDGVPAAISALPEVVHVEAGRVPIIFDSGIRRGIDVLRALALGANAVAVGRPVLYGLALGGPKGVQSVLQQLRHELTTAMLLAGVKSVKQLDTSYLQL